MSCLGSVLYDPTTLASTSCASLLAMTALDTTNARITFTAPANGKVLVRVRVHGKGATATPMIVLGCLDGSTVKMRQSAMIAVRTASSSATLYTFEAAALVTGLTPSASYTFDAAYGVEVVTASFLLGWGGPNNTTTSDAYGALSFEVWETENLLAGTHYDPSTAVLKSTASNLAMTAIDTTNLRLSFTTAASGAGSSRVAVRLRTMCSGSSTAFPVFHLGVLDGSTVKMRQVGLGWLTGGGTVVATDRIVQEALGVVTVSPSTSYTWDAAYGVELLAASTNIKYGGPNNTTADDGYGGFTFEVWAA